MAAASAGASATEPFSIRGFAARKRAEDAAKCCLLGGRGEVETYLPPQLPPMDPPPQSRWWAHEIAAVRARSGVCAADGEASMGAGMGDGLGKATKRKGSRVSGSAERAKKRQRALQLGFSQQKERTSNLQSPSCLLQHMFHKELLRKRKGCAIRTMGEFVVRKKSQDQEDHMSTHGDSLKNQCGRRMDDKISTKVTRPTNHPLNPCCEVVKDVACPPKDDIFGDLPLLESSKIMFHAGVDILPTIIEDSIVANQDGPDAISETEPLKLVPTSDILKQTSSLLEDLVNKEGIPDKESTCISRNDAGRNHSSAAEFDVPLNHTNVTMVKSCLTGMQLKSTDIPALSSYCKEGAKSGSGNPPQGCFYTNTNCFQEIKRPVTSSASVRTRTKAVKEDRNAAVGGKNSTDISGRLIPTEDHLSREGSLLSSVISQGTVNAGINIAGMSSCRIMPTQEYAPTSSPSCTFASTVCHESRKSLDTFTSLSMDDQGSWYSKVHPQASIDLPLMKLPGLERLEISSYDPRTGKNNFLNGRSMDTIRCQKQQLVSGMTNIVQGQNKIGFSDSQAEIKALDDFLRRGNCHSNQPTMRLMGKTVSVCKRSKEEESSTTGKVWIENTIRDHPSSISCQVPPKRLFPYEDSVIPRARVLESSGTVPRIPNSTVAEARPIVSDAQNHRLQQTNSISLAVKNCTWKSGSQFGQQAPVNKESVIGVSSRSRHLEQYQPPKFVGIPRNQYLHLSTPASSMHAVNQSSPFPQCPLNTSMQGKYQKPTSLTYIDPKSVPTYQPCQLPGTRPFSTSIISFHDCGTNNAESRKSYQRAHTSLTASLASKSISAISPMCTGSLLNIDGRKGVSFVDQTSKRPACADNVPQQPTKRQLVADKLELTSPMFPNTKNYSFGWSLNDAVGPRILDFSNKLAGIATHISNENNNFGNNLVPVVEARSRIVSMVAGAKTTLRPGQNLNDHSKMPHSTKLSVDNGFNSALR